ncbi:MAG TPA: hypothetical protein VG847_14770 [Chitinophagaceae bacterium]|nr:hypothetical protein [Chitinophagaceae bacterium]
MRIKNLLKIIPVKILLKRQNGNGLIQMTGCSELSSDFCLAGDDFAGKFYKL